MRRQSPLERRGMNGGGYAFPLTLLFAAFMLSAVAVGLVRKRALQSGVLDVPNERSSHTMPTPRGGGLGLFIVVAALWTSMLIVWRPPASLAFALCLVGMAAVAAVGWIDDTRGLSVRARFVVHALAGSSVALLGVTVGWPALATFWWFFWVVSAINVVNFMDGIDGLIATQAIIGALSIAHLALPTGFARPVALVLAGASAGFLAWNWPPARIFLGDVGSGALGFALAFVGAIAIAEGGTSFVRAFLPLYPLFLDATTTIARRLLRRERITSAHRAHLYQRLANGGWGHARVTLLYATAALPGAFIAGIAQSAMRWRLITMYIVVTLVVGYALDRRVGWRGVGIARGHH